VARPSRVCLEPGCAALVASGRCPTHSQQHRRLVNISALHGLYRTARWRRLRAQKLNEDPFCVDCQAEGITRVWDELDHEVPHRGDLELFWDETNLRGRCAEHHTVKTRRGL